MNTHGDWHPYLNEPMFDWYELPHGLAEELATYQSDGNEMEPLTDSQWRQAYQTTVAFAEWSVQSYDNPFHNSWHLELVQQRGVQAVGAFERLTGRQIPLIVKQAFTIALRLHDCLHCGAAFRADSQKPLHYPELGTTISQEWISAMAANDLMQRAGFSVLARLFQVMVIWSSTYGGHTLRGKHLGIPVVQPVGFWGRLMRAADVCPPATDIVSALTYYAAITYGEIPAEPGAATWEDMVISQTKFFDYVMLCYRQLDEVAGVSLTKELGWYDTLVSLRTQLSELRRHTVNGDAVEKEILKYGIVLQ